MLAVYRVLSRSGVVAVWALWESNSDDSHWSTTGLQWEKCSELLIHNLQMGKKQKSDFPSSRTAVVLLELAMLCTSEYTLFRPQWNFLSLQLYSHVSEIYFWLPELQMEPVTSRFFAPACCTYKEVPHFMGSLCNSMTAATHWGRDLCHQFYFILCFLAFSHHP